MFKILFVSAALAAVVASSLSSHASVSRMIYVMGRNGRGRIPRFLSYIHPTFLTPTHAVLIVGIVSLLAVKFTLEFISSMINFGALIAFTVVPLTVIVFYAFRLKQRRTAKEIFRNIVLPFIGMCLTGVLWANLHFDALLYGAIWLAIGIILLVYMTRGLRQPLTMKIEEETPCRGGHTRAPHQARRRVTTGKPSGSPAARTPHRPDRTRRWKAKQGRDATGTGGPDRRPTPSGAAS